MTNLMRISVTQIGWEGGPGIAHWYFSQGTLSVVDAETAQIAADELRGMYYGVRGCWRPGITFTVEPDVPIIDVASGDIVDIVTMATPPASFTVDAGSGTEAFSTAICVQHLSDQFRAGRLVKGRKFFSPLSNENLDTGGNISATVASGIVAAHAAMISGVGPRLAVYSRPTPKNSMTGDWADVVTVKVSTKPAVLQSRR